MSPRSRRPDERGSATVLMVGAMAVVAILAGLAMVLTGYAVAAHRARAAADLAALSAASAYENGADGCAAARLVAGRNGATLTHCERVGDQVDFVFTVRVAVAVSTSTPGLPSRVPAEARAGPVR